MPSDRDTLLRQWQMLRFVPRYPSKVEAKEVQAHLEAVGFSVTKRTIERDLQTLSRIFPLQCDEREKPFGWSWRKDAPAFDLPGINSAEAFGLKLLADHLRPLMPASLLNRLEPYFRLADERLRGLPKKPNAASWPKKVRMVPPTQPLIPPKINPEVQQIVFDALLEDCQVRVTYRKRGDPGLSESVLHPLGIVQRGPVTYLIATAFDYNDARVYALHRFQSAEALDAPVKRPPGFDLDAFIATGVFGWGGPDNIRQIRLEAIFENGAAAHLYETPLSEDQVLAPVGANRTRLIATIANTAQLRWWLLGFGDDVQVTKPAALRRQLRDTANGMVAAYKRT